MSHSRNTKFRSVLAITLGLLLSSKIGAQDIVISLPIEHRPFQLGFLDKDAYLSETFSESLIFASLPENQYVPIDYGHPLVSACRQAYANHQGFVISPEVIWLTILQGIAICVSQNSDSLKDQFTNTNEKITIRLTLPNSRIDWVDVIQQLTDRSLESLPTKWKEFSDTRFSTTEPQHRSVFNLGFLDIVDSYFIYEGDILCGIPKVKIRGDRSDWRLLSDKLEILSEIGMEWWLDDLRFILKKIDDCYDNKIDIEFFSSIYQNRKDGCKEPYIGGWITKFIPYVKDRKGSNYLINQSLLNRSQEIGYKMSRFPSGRSTITFALDEVPYSIEGGILGSTLSEGNFINPQLGWVVLCQNKKVE